MNVASIVGITLAGTAVFAVLAFLVFKFVRRRQQHQRHTATGKALDAAPVATPHTTSVSAAHSFKASGPSDSNNNNTSNSLWDDDDDVALRIPLEKVTIASLVSRGGYGEVYAGTYKTQRVAIKMLLPHARKDMRQIRAFVAEAKLLAALDHPHIVSFVGVAWDSLSDLCVVSEFMDGGDLRALLTRFDDEERRPRGFDHDKVKIAFHVAHALTYLHSLQPVVLHRNLKSKNILLNSHLDAKVTDFGVSRESSDRTMTAGVGTSLWMAPEVMMGERYDEKSDIFSFGVVLSELDSHALPYAQAKTTDSGRQLPDTALLQMVSLGRLRVELSPNAPQTLVDLTAACTALDPSERPTAADAMYKLQVALKMYQTYVL